MSTLAELMTTPPGPATMIIPVCDSCGGSLGMDGEPVAADRQITFDPKDANPAYSRVRAFDMKVRAREALLQHGWDSDGDNVLCPTCKGIAQ